MGLLNSLRTLVTKCLILIWVTVLLIPLTACNPAALTANPNQPPELVMTILSDPKTFNPVIATDETSSSVGGMLFDGLTTQNPITGEVKPALAKSWSISDDNLEIVYTLRPNLQWSDGYPLTADDVVFTYNQIYLNPDIPTGMRDILKIGQSEGFPEIIKINDLQVKFTIPEPFAPFLEVTGASIYPAHILRETVEQKGKDGNLKFLSTWSLDTPPENIVASSAYKLKSYATSERLVFEANPNYWKKEVVNEPLPYIKRVIWEIVESTDTSLVQFRSGSLDSLSVSPEYFSLLKKEEKKGNFRIEEGGEVYSMTFIAFNLNQGKKNGKPVISPNKSDWFNNVNFRQAVSYGINRDRMIKNIFRGLGAPQNSFMPKQSPFYDASIEGYPYNPEKAKQLLLEAGFKYNKQGQLFDQKGDRVSFTLNTNTGNTIREAMGNQIEEDLATIGIKVNFRTVNFNVLIGKLDNTLDWDCILLGFTGGNEPNNGYNLWAVDGNSHLFNQNVPDLKDRKIADWESEIARLYIEGARELDRKKRKATYSQVQQLVSEQLPVICLVNPYSMAAIRNKIKGVEYSALGGAFWNLEELKITK
ncbi:ABC transporter substrate-binding protein [Pleurocapsa sp. FMAR1]|uniref:ABC transporter substrate-binding protein n=1 Tax=Pleurocapsa sp. FMAR1 TaxID=3040204 RepID=UPI0039B0619B